jgi:signal transduction histidine kinase
MLLLARRAHDLNNELTVVAMHAELALLDSTDPDAQKRLREVWESAQRAIAINRDLSRWYRYDPQEAEPASKSVSLLLHEV